MTDLDAIPFLQAAHYTPANRTAVSWIVIHTAEVGATVGSAEALQRACARVQAEPKRRKSWHYAVDSDSIAQSVRDTDVAWHAPRANKLGIGIELATRADAAAWSDAYHVAMLGRAAGLVRALCDRWSIPLQVVSPSGLVAGVAGITGHAAVSEAFKASNHTDPGKRFPWAAFLHSAVVAGAAPVA